jgi:hypothetical protein
MIIRKNMNTVSIINDWLTMCCCEDITDAPSLIQNDNCFVDHRHDQALLSIILYKHKIQTYHFEKRYVQNVRLPY